MSVIDYVVLTKPKITFLNLLTASTAFILGGGELADILPLLIVGYLAVGGSSAINHYMDRGIDAKMSRTSSRPLPRGIIRPPEKALILGVSLLASSLVISFKTLNALATSFIALGAFIYIFVYTIWLKRRTPWNIVIGGAAGSCAPLTGWAAATGTVAPLPLLMALLIFLWTPGHFWGLAIRAERDYRDVGIPMLPAVVGIERASNVTAISNIITIICWLIIGLLLPSSLSYFIITTPMTILLLIQNVKLMVRPSKPIAWAVFKTSSPWLAIVMVGLSSYIFIGV